jgi:hypothetical protein
MNGVTAAALAFIKLKRDSSMNEARLKNETKVADAVAAPGRGPDLAVLTNAEFFRFDALHARLAAGAGLTGSESVEYAQLMMRSLNPSLPPVIVEAGPQAASLTAPHVPVDGEEVARLFELDEDI